MAEMDNKMLAEVFADMQDIGGFEFTGYKDTEIKNIFANFAEPDFDELDNDSDIDEAIAVKITFDNTKEYLQYEKEIKEFVQRANAQMVVTR